MNTLRLGSLVLAAALAACARSETATVEPQAGNKAPDTAYPVAVATLNGPITGGIHGHALWDSWFDLDPLGYMDEEYFVSGTAKVQPDGSEAPYVTRFIITRPKDAKDFNGTVVLDWVNVTAQFENPVDTLEAHAYLMRHGYAWAHVSAQAAGLCCIPLTPETWDPVRYGSLNHPGDDYAYDMFAQVARALREPGEVDAMGGLKVKRVLAMGQSQSAQKLHDYVNLGYARSRVIDGILIHGDVGSGKQFSEMPVPVIQLLSDNEAATEEPGPAVPANYALWEIAGTAHTDQYVGLHQIEGQSGRVLADAPRQPSTADADLHKSIGNYGEQYTPFDGVCVAAGESFPMRYAVDAALDYLNAWNGGKGAPSGPRFAFDSSGALARDAYQNALGGIRYPPIDVPVASYVSTPCYLGGFTVPFTEVQLAQLYPTHADYFCKMQAATRAAVMTGFLLPEDADDLMARVDAAQNRWLDAGTRDCE